MHGFEWNWWRQWSMLYFAYESSNFFELLNFCNLSIWIYFSLKTLSFPPHFFIKSALFLPLHLSIFFFSLFFHPNSACFFGIWFFYKLFYSMRVVIAPSTPRDFYLMRAYLMSLLLFYFLTQSFAHSSLILFTLFHSVPSSLALSLTLFQTSRNIR